jgi:hypothetical protein
VVAVRVYPFVTKLTDCTPVKPSEKFGRVVAETVLTLRLYSRHQERYVVLKSDRLLTHALPIGISMAPPSRA